MQFQVPQFIESEDKVVGPLSLRQFAFVGIAAILSAVLYLFAETWLWFLLSLIIFGIAGALAFVKIEGRPFISVAISAFNFYWKPQTYVWQPEHPTVRWSEKKKDADAGGSALEEIIAKSTTGTRPPTINSGLIGSGGSPFTRASASTGSALHKSWEDVQTGAPLVKKNSDKQFLERKMSERYQIFQRISGERNASKRIDYR